MKILINSAPIDVRLESEKTLGEVYVSLCDWIKGAGLYPLTLFLDSQEFDIVHKSQWETRSLESINCFDLQAGNINQLRQQQLMTIIDYLLLLKQLIDQTRKGENVQEEFYNAYNEYPHIRAALPQLLQLKEADFATDFTMLDQIVNEIHKSGADSKNLQKFNEALELLRLILLDRLNELTHPVKCIRHASSLLQTLLPALEDAGLSFQTGNEGDAYSMMFKISEIIAKVVRLVEILSIEYPQDSLDKLKELSSKLGIIVDEINENIKSKDSVMLADILEYDLHELLSDIIEQTSLIKPEEA